ncbi:MAG: DUF1178 family protein [Sulfitobacter sp.]
MIRYALKCRDGHVFDSWFQSATAFEALARAGHLTCAVCGIGDVEKTLMSPQVAPKGRSADETPPQDPSKSAQRGDAPPEQLPASSDGQGAPATASEQEQAIAQMRRSVEENATYVGGKFAEKAREMHEGTAPETSIYGEASGAEARALIEEGVPVIPLPFKPKQKLQ